jgi:nitrogen-specific signal transduction histidine kinase
VANQHRGTIDVESNPEQTTFIVTIPIAPSET